MCKTTFGKFILNIVNFLKVNLFNFDLIMYLPHFK